MSIRVSEVNRWCMEGFGSVWVIFYCVYVVGNVLF